MGKYKESKDNPLHRDYGVLRNTAYMMGKIRCYRPVVFILALVNLICSSALGYYWGFFGKFVIDLISSGKTTEEALPALLLILGLGLLTALTINFLCEFAGTKVWPLYIEVRMGVISERVNKALHVNYEMLEKPEILDLHERATQATNSNDEGIEGMMHILQDLGKNLLTVAVTFTAVTVLDVRLILALAVLAVISFLYYSVVIKKDKQEVWDRLSPTWRKIAYMGRVTQHFSFAKEIRLFSLKPFLTKKQQDIYVSKEERIDFHHDIWNGYVLLGQGLNLISRGLVYTVLYLAVLREESPLSIGSFTLYLALASSFSGALITLLQRWGDYAKASMKVDDLRSFLSLGEEEEQKETLPIPSCDSYVFEFQRVSFRYPGAERDALKDFSLTLNAGEKLAVVGLNGAGKTTMIKLLLRLYEPTSGQILLNGTDIRSFDREEYYRLFSPVFQDAQLFAVKLGENVAMCTDRELNRDCAEQCLREAGLSEKLDQLPAGLDTEVLKVVSEEGMDLSGGEKQKLALARALYRHAPVIVLDEPTAALDALAEKQLYERFDRMVNGSSAVYISHRLASTRFCDRIALFENGRMVELGTHDELMEKGGAYRKLFDVQARYYREDHGEEAENL